MSDVFSNHLSITVPLSPLDRAYSCQGWSRGFESHDIQYVFFFKKKNIFIFYHKSCLWLARFLHDLRIKVNVIEFILKHYISLELWCLLINLKKKIISKDTFLIANVSNYFEKHSGWDSSSYIQQTVQANGVSRRSVFRVQKDLHETGTLSSPQLSKRGQYKAVDNFDEVVIRSFTPTAISFRP